MGRKARRLAVMAPDTSVLCCSVASARLNSSGAETLEVGPDAWQVLWVPAGGLLERRRSVRMDRETLGGSAPWGEIARSVACVATSDGGRPPGLTRHRRDCCGVGIGWPSIFSTYILT